MAATATGPTDQRAVLALAGPALTENLLISVVSMVDLMMVGRLGAAALAAVGLSTHPVMFFQSVFIALNVGTTALVARLVGAGDERTAREAARQTLAVAAAVGVAVSLAAFVCARHVLTLMGTAADVLPGGVAYFRAVALGLGCNAVAMNMAASLRGAGDTRTPAAVNILANLVNLTGNYVLIYGKLGLPALGVLGAGVATTLARLVSCLCFAYVVFSGSSRIAVRLRQPYRPDLELLARAFRVGYPAAAEQFVLRGGQVVFLRVVSGLGTGVIAAHHVGTNIINLTFMVGQSFGVAATTLVGQGLGARDPGRAERAARTASRLGVTVACAIAASFFFFGRQLAGLYTRDPVVIAQTALALRIYAPAQPAQSTRFVLAGALRGAGDTRWTLLATAVGIWGFRVAVGLALVRGLGLGLAGAWVAIAADQVGRAWLITRRFNCGRWKELQV